MSAKDSGRGDSSAAEVATIRPAAPHEAETLTELVLRSKAHWGYSADFLSRCRAELTVSADDIANGPAAYYLCCLQDSIVAYYAIEPLAASEYELEALFVEPQCIGRGYGRFLIDHAKAVAFERGAKTLLIQGDPHAEAFYLAAGGRRIGERESASVAGRYLPLFRIALG